MVNTCVLFNLYYLYFQPCEELLQAKLYSLIIVALAQTKAQEYETGILSYSLSPFLNYSARL